MTHLLEEGGYEFMIPLLILLFTSIILIIKGVKNNSEKNLKLLKSIGLFALVFGFFGATLGFIQMLDVIPLATSIDSGVLAQGIKFTILPPTFGMSIFLVGRAGVTILIGFQKEN